MASKAPRASKHDAAKKLKVTLLRSTTGFNRAQAKVVEGLGLRRIGHSVEIIDHPAMRGMILKVRHLVKVDDE